MWGSPGTILAGRELGLDVSASCDWLRSRRDADGLWTQHLYGRFTRYLGPAHGFAGCALALGEAAGVSETLERLAVEQDGLVNWPAVAGERLTDTGDGLIRTQWCHGAPGIVATLAPLLDEELATAAGELTWHAGPVRKGAGLCHGTAGNGYAFLALLERTGDERWLARARAFASPCRASGGAEPLAARTWPPHALDGRPRHGALSRRLPRRRRQDPGAMRTWSQLSDGSGGIVASSANGPP